MLPILKALDCLDVNDLRILWEILWHAERLAGGCGIAVPTVVSQGKCF